MRCGVLESGRVRQARQEEVNWVRGTGVREPVLRKDMEAEGAKAISLRWIDTDEVDADRPNCRSRLVVREIEKPMKKSEVSSAAELFSGLLSLCSSLTVTERRRASKLWQCTTSVARTSTE